MTELDRSLFINYRVGNLAIPYSYDLFPFLTFFIRLEKVNSRVYIIICENGAWFVLEDDKRLTKYIKTLDGIYDNLSKTAFD